VLSHDVDGAGPRLVLVHGFTQTRAHWAAVAAELAAGHEVVRVDAPGHGGSADLTADLRDGADLLAATTGRATFVGYSMGGRLCLHLALAHPDLAAGLVLVGASPGIDDQAKRQQRIAADEVWARRLEEEGLDTFLAEWLAQPLFAGLDERAADVGARRENTAAGLAASLRLAGAGAQQPLWERLAELAMPVLVVAGEDDRRFTILARRMADAIGDSAEVAVVPGAGHGVHLEAPSAFLEILRPWLRHHQL
jgi:2-succinyl-6-hydroxy-2,4-cyclohexadiene-1-carboxylate synthase